FLLCFVESLNNNANNIKLTCHYSCESIDFLDIRIIKGKDGFLQRQNAFAKKNLPNKDKSWICKNALRSAGTLGVPLEIAEKEHLPNSFAVRTALGKYCPIIKEDRVLTVSKKDTAELERVQRRATKVIRGLGVTYQRNKNLRDLLSHSYYKGQESTCKFGSKGPKWGFYPCKNCAACKNLERSFSFCSSDGSKEFRITHHITCCTENVI
ncbi:unnamed protein product, partial [Ranitomeya imitator]